MITTNRIWRYAVPSLMVACFFICFGSMGFAEDVLIVKKKKSDETFRRKGIIEQWLGYSVTISSNGSLKDIDSTLIVELQTIWPAAYESGNRLAAAGKTKQAIQKYREALTEEKRPWAQRIIRSKLVTAYQLIGNAPAAINEFRSILNEDPNTRFMHLMPLPWSNRIQPVNGASDWLNSDQSAVQLLGAGWSLISRQKEQAAAALDQLAGDLDPRIRDLATAQLWRLQTQLNPKEVRQLQGIVDGMEPGNRAGGLLILANAEQKQGNLDAAILNWMKIVTLHEDQSMLVAASLSQTASALRSRDPNLAKQKTYPKPDRFTAELRNRFPESTWAKQAMFDTRKN